MGWGLNSHGVLCAAPSKLPKAITPVRVAQRVPGVAAQVTCGSHLALLLTEEGEVWAWGLNRSGRLGVGDGEERHEAVRVSGLPPVAAVAAGDAHCAALDRACLHVGLRLAGGAGAWGAGDEARPRRVEALAGARVASVSCGRQATAAVTVAGELFVWGCNRRGKLGLGDEESRGVPCRVDPAALGGRVRCVALGGAHGAAVTEEGRLFAWGANDEGQLGAGAAAAASRAAPAEVRRSAPGRFAAASCSAGEAHGHTLALDCSGALHAFGATYKGQLGVEAGGAARVASPRPVEGLAARPVRAAAAGGIHSACVTQDGALLTWGCGSDGRLGHPDAAGHRYLYREGTPRAVELPGRVLCAAASYYNTLCIVELPHPAPAPSRCAL
eukprot:tig00001339_g8275.t1